MAALWQRAWGGIVGARSADRAGIAQDATQTCEVIRPYTPAALGAWFAQQGFDAERSWWDYGRRADERDAQFFTLLARARR